MKNTKQLSVITVIAALVISGAATCAFASPTSQTSDTLASLKRGMPAKEVQQLLGEPVAVKPMNSPNGKAEVWVYQKPIGEFRQQLYVGSTPIRAVLNSRGCDAPTQVAELPIIKLERNITAETVSVLMFNNHLLAKKTETTVTKQFE